MIDTRNAGFQIRKSGKMEIGKSYTSVAGQRSDCTKPARPEYATALICLLALSGCGESDVEVVAQASHDFNGNFELFSYQAKPSKRLGQAEAIAKKPHGELLSEVKSPSTRFVCLWRNTSFKKLDDGRPAEIFLTCMFGPTPVETPKSLVEMANINNTIDRANLKATWKFENGNYQLSRFEVEILADKKSYRSQNLAADMQQIKVVQDEMRFPRKAGDPFQFSLQSRLPHRRNSGDAQREPIVSVSFSGLAEPIPGWVNY